MPKKENITVKDVMSIVVQDVKEDYGLNLEKYAEGLSSYIAGRRDSKAPETKAKREDMLEIPECGPLSSEDMEKVYETYKFLEKVWGGNTHGWIKILCSKLKKTPSQVQTARYALENLGLIEKE